jgi:N-acetylmuramoyl-L-alanine amidase
MVAIDPLDAGEQIDEFALALFRVAGGESIRVIEALAAALANRLSRTGDPDAFVLEEASAPGLAEAPSAWIPCESPKWQACRRIARRALRGSLADPTCGATAFHHIEASPPWCREHLPVAVHGPFLFYRV